MISWQAFEKEQPLLAEAGKKRLVGGDGVAIAFISTVSSRGESNIAPVCPVFSGQHLHLVASAETPKTRDLLSNGRYALHAFLGDNDEEFQISGRGVFIEDSIEKEQVQEDIPFPSFNESDPIFRLLVDRALRVYWENVGQPNTRPVRQSWRFHG